MFPAPPLSARSSAPDRGVSSRRRALSARGPTRSPRWKRSVAHQAVGPSPYSLQPFQLLGRRETINRQPPQTKNLPAFNNAVNYTSRGSAVTGEPPMLVQNMPKLRDVRRKRQQTEEEMQKMQNRIHKLQVFYFAITEPVLHSYGCFRRHWRRSLGNC